MRQATARDLSDLLKDHQPPCITLYLQSNRQYPGSLENPIRLKNLLREAEEQLTSQFPNRRENTRLLKQIESTPGDRRDFWMRQDALAVFCSPDYFLAVAVQAPVDESVSVGRTFRTTPLVRSFQTAGRYHVLCFESHDVRLFEGNQHALEPVELREVPSSIEQVKADRSWNVRYASARGYPAPAANRPAKPDLGAEENHDLLTFMRIVDRAIWENHSRQAALPMVLCAAEVHHRPFHQITCNANLASEGIHVDPHALSPDRIRDEAWAVVSPHYQRRIEQIVDAFRSAKAQNLGSDAIETVTHAAAMGRVGTLLVDSAKHIPGHLDPTTGQIEHREPSKDGRMGEDVLDDTAERVLRTGGVVFVLPHEIMPTDSGLAAIYRY